MLASRALLSLRRLPTIARACSNAQSGGSSTENDGLASFLNIVQSTQKQLEESRLREEEAAQLTDANQEKPRFTKLLRNSHLVRLGYIKNGFVTKGVIKNVVDDTIFIDFGGKFPMITKKPEAHNEFYVRGAEVLVRIVDWELTARFIGAETDSTLCESDGRVLRLLSSPLKVDGRVEWQDAGRTEALPSPNSDLSEIDAYLEMLEAGKPSGDERPKKPQ